MKNKKDDKPVIKIESIIAFISIAFMTFPFYILTPGCRFTLLVKNTGICFDIICTFDSIITFLMKPLYIGYSFFQIDSFLSSSLVTDIVFMLSFIIQFVLMYKIILDPYILLKSIRKVRYSLLDNIYHNALVVVSLIALLFILTYPIIYYQENYFYLSKYFYPLLSVLLFIMLLTFVVKLIKKKPDDIEESQLYQNDSSDIVLSEKDNNKTYVDRLFSNIESMKAGKDFFSIALNGSWGMGKTTILENLRTKLEDNDYKVIWLNVWQLKNTDNLIGEIERAVLKFCKESIYFVPHELYSYFELLNKIHSNKTVETTLSTALNWMKKKTFEESMEVTKELIERALKAANKKKLIFIFDDIDRILEREESINVLKTIRYITNFENSIAVSGLDVEVVAKVIEEKESQLNGHSFLNKIFNLVIELYSKNEQYELISYLRERWGVIKREIFKINKEEMGALDELINGGDFYNIFRNYREIKLTMNEFFGSFSLMDSLAKNVNGKVIDNISINDVFIMSALKIIDGEFYRDFFVQIKSRLYKENVECGVLMENYLNARLLTEVKNKSEDYYFRNDNSKRIFHLFMLLSGLRTMTFNEKQSSDGSKYIVYDRELRKELSILEVSVFYYYINPAMKRYQFSNYEVAEHVKISFTFSNSESSELWENKIVKSTTKIFEQKIDKLKPNCGAFEYNELIIDYLNKIYGMSFYTGDPDYRRLGHDLIKVTITSIIHFLLDNHVAYFRGMQIEYWIRLYSFLFIKDLKEIYWEENIVSVVLRLISCDNKQLPLVVTSLFEVYASCSDDKLRDGVNLWIGKMENYIGFDYCKLAILLHFYKVAAERGGIENFVSYLKTIFKEVASLKIKNKIVESKDFDSLLLNQLFDFYKDCLNKFILEKITKATNPVRELYRAVSFFLRYFKAFEKGYPNYYLLCKNEMALGVLGSINKNFISLILLADNIKNNFGDENLFRNEIYNQRNCIDLLEKFLAKLKREYGNKTEGFETLEKRLAEKYENFQINLDKITGGYLQIIDKLRNKLRDLERPPELPKS